MPLKLNIPAHATGYPVLKLGNSPPRVRGKELRLARAKEMEAEARDREAQMQVTLICCTLWAGFWFQFVIGVLYNMPAIYTLSGGNWFAPDYEFFIETRSSYPFPSVAENFLFYSVFGSAVAISFAWLFTRGVTGKWRLRFAVALFVTITLGWSIYSWKAEEAAWTVGIDQKTARIRQLLEWEMNDIGREEFRSLQEERIQRLQEKVSKLEQLKKTRKWDGD